MAAATRDINMKSEFSSDLLQEKIGRTNYINPEQLEKNRKGLLQACANLAASQQPRNSGNSKVYKLKSKRVLSEAELRQRREQLEKHRYYRPKGFKFSKPFVVSEEERERRRQAIAKGREIYIKNCAARRKAKEEALKKEQQAKERAQKRAQLEKEWAEKNPKATNGYGWTLSDRRANVPERGLKKGTASKGTRSAKSTA